MDQSGTYRAEMPSSDPQQEQIIVAAVGGYILVQSIDLRFWTFENLVEQTSGSHQDPGDVEFSFFFAAEVPSFSSWSLVIGLAKRLT